MLEVLLIVVVDIKLEMAANLVTVPPQFPPCHFGMCTIMHVSFAAREARSLIISLDGARNTSKGVCQRKTWQGRERD